ncbi:MAG TPA: hypothetical protein VKV96_02400 [Roseiarcus sp.]|nr:hypothetical protein [Roseiarcus sp.]
MRNNDPAVGRLFRVKGRGPEMIIRVRRRHPGEEEWMSGETFSDETVIDPDGKALSEGPHMIDSAAPADNLELLSDEEAGAVEQSWAARLGAGGRRAGRAP